MMSALRIILSTNQINAPSTVLNRALLEKIGEEFCFNGTLESQDVILFMGYDPKIEIARHENPSALIGIVDPRPGCEKELTKADFFLANGVEMINYFAHVNSNGFIYPIYPPLAKCYLPVQKKELSTFKIGYHGNKAHLTLMEDSVCKALARLAPVLNIELHCIYNMDSLGKWEYDISGVKIVHHQWESASYEAILSLCDIGIVPNLIPFSPKLSRADRKLEKSNLAFNSDILNRFKPTSNVGRILVFAQLGIPVIADMFPSSAEIIRHGFSGYLATDVNSWYVHLKNMIDDSRGRQTMGANLQDVFLRHYNIRKKNAELLNFLRKMQIVKKTLQDKLNT